MNKNINKKTRPTKITIPKIAEDVLNKQCVQYFNMCYASTGALLHHSPNENPRGSKIQMKCYNNKMKSIGLAAGFPDIVIFYNGKVLLIELKSSTGRLSDNQKSVIEKLDMNGFKTHIINNLDDFVVLVNDFFNST